MNEFLEPAKRQQFKLITHTALPRAIQDVPYTQISHTSYIFIVTLLAIITEKLECI